MNRDLFSIVHSTRLLYSLFSPATSICVTATRYSCELLVTLRTSLLQQMFSSCHHFSSLPLCHQFVHTQKKYQILLLLVLFIFIGISPSYYALVSISTLQYSMFLCRQFFLQLRQHAGMQIKILIVRLSDKRVVVLTSKLYHECITNSRIIERSNYL